MKKKARKPRRAKLSSWYLQRRHGRSYRTVAVLLAVEGYDLSTGKIRAPAPDEVIFTGLVEPKNPEQILFHEKARDVRGHIDRYRLLVQTADEVYARMTFDARPSSWELKQIPGVGIVVRHGLQLMSDVREGQ